MKSLGESEAVEALNDEPDADAFRDVLCAHLATLAPNLAQKVREATKDCPSYVEVLLGASLVVAKEVDGSDLDDLVKIDDFLRSFGVEPVAGTERLVDVVKPALASTEAIVEATREGIYRRRVHTACEGLLPMDRMELILTTHPLEEPFDVGLYNTAVIWVAEALFAKMDKSSVEAQRSKTAKGREEKRLKALAREQAITVLAEKGLVNPVE